jgi:hypothetical protein
MFQLTLHSQSLLRMDSNENKGPRRCKLWSHFCIRNYQPLCVVIWPLIEFIYLSFERKLSAWAGAKLGCGSAYSKIEPWHGQNICTDIAHINIQLHTAWLHLVYSCSWLIWWAWLVGMRSNWLTILMVAFHMFCHCTISQAIGICTFSHHCNQHQTQFWSSSHDSLTISMPNIVCSYLSIHQEKTQGDR